MARSFHVPGPRMRGLASARGAALMLMLMLLALVAVQWMAGAPVDSILPVEPPA